MAQPFFAPIDDALAKRFGKPSGTNRQGQQRYLITNPAGYQQAKARERQAFSGGFGSAQEMDLNRMMRNQLETKAAALGIPVNEAYAMVPGGDLTNTGALQEAWNKLGQSTQQQQTAPRPQATSPTYGKTYSYTDPGDAGYFGMKDYEELAAQGASRADLIRYAFAAPKGVGPAVASKLGIRAYDQPTPSSLSYTDPGDKGFFGMKDFEELASQGATFEQIKDYAKKARYGVGGEAASILNLRPASEGDFTVARADVLARELQDEEKRMAEAKRLSDEMRIKSERPLAANMARAGRTPNLQIGQAGTTPTTGGTTPFKRRRGPASIAGLAAQPSILNV